MNKEVENKLKLLKDFCREQRISIEATEDGYGDYYIDLNLHNSAGDLIEYDNIGHTITYL